MRNEKSQFSTPAKENITIIVLNDMHVKQSSSHDISADLNMSFKVNPYFSPVI